MRLSNPLPNPLVWRGRLPIALLLLAMLAAACGSDGASTTTGTSDGGNAVPGEKLIDQVWQFTNSIVGGDAVVPVDPGVVATFQVTGGQVIGFAGCNTFSGEATLDADGTSLSISNLAITEIGCEDSTDWMPVLDLGGVWNVAINGDNLALTAVDGSGAGFDLVPLTDGATGEPKSDNPLNDAIAADYLGLTEDEALSQATQDGRPARVVERDGEPLPVTLDYNPDRLNFTISSDVVTHVEFG